MSKFILLMITCALASSPAWGSGTESVKHLQSTLRQWVELEKTISEEENAWAIEGELIGDSITVLRNQKATFEERKAAAEETVSKAETEREELVTDRDKLQAISGLMEAEIRKREAEMRVLLRRLPEPLRQELSTVARRIPSDPDNSTLGLAVRTQNLVSILSQVDRFNTAVTRVAEIRDVEGGSREVTTLYFGLAVAYFVDTSGEYAGYGVPGDDGWVWRTDPTLAGTLRSLLAVHEGTREAHFIGLPVTIH